MILKGPGLLPDEMWPAREPLAAHRFIQLSDGERARVVESGRNAGPPVLFLHGWGASAYQYRRNILPVGQAGYRAIAVDLRGHGLSDKPLRQGAYTLEAMCAHVLRILDALELDRVAVVGQSMSGRIALEIALTSPDRVERIGLIDPIGLGVLRVRRLAKVASLPVLDPLMPYLLRRALIKLGLRAIYGDADKVSDEDVEEYWAPARFPSFSRAMARLLREFSWDTMQEDRLKELQQPALVIFGKLDRLVRPDPDGPLLQPRDDYSVRYLDAAGHVANQEAADEVNAALLAFLAGDEIPAFASSAGSEAGPESASSLPAKSPDGEGAVDRAGLEKHPVEGAEPRPAHSKKNGRHSGSTGSTTEEIQKFSAADSAHEPRSGRKKRRRGKQRQRKADDEA